MQAKFLNLELLTQVSGPGTYFITPPGYNDSVPAGYTQISSPTNSVWLLSRTAVTNQQEPNTVTAANNIQQGYTITPPSGGS